MLVDVPPVPDLSALMDVDGSNISPPQDDPSGSVDADANASTSLKDAIKVVKKMEFQLLCPQHNPVSVNPTQSWEFFVAYRAFGVALARSQKGEQAGQDSERLACSSADVEDQDSR